MRGSWLLILCALAAFSTGAQTTNVGKPIPASLFGFTVFDPALTPVLPHTIVRSWDSQHVAWFSLNPSRGVYNWKTLDAFTSGHTGKDMIYTFGLVPGWAASIPAYGTPYRYGSSCSMPADINDWDAFVTAIATHVGEKIKYWELWNEPMSYQYWCTGPDRNADFAKFALMAKHANAIIKKIIPDALILSPSTDKGFGQVWFNKFLLAGGTNTFDVVTIHGYPDHPVEGMVPMISQYQTLMAKYGISNLPIWDTETAWGNPVADSAWLAKMYLLSWSAGVSRTIWYAYDHNGVPLWSPATGLSDAGKGYNTLYGWLVGATLTSACGQDSAGTYTCPITRKGYRGEIMWNSTSSVSIAAPKGFTRYRDLQGGTYPLVNGRAPIGNSPILLETSSFRKAN